MPSGVFVRALSARIRSHGLSTPRRTACVEDASAGNLELREPDAVEELGEPQEVGGRHPPGQRLLAEQADSRVDERRHEERVTRSLGSRS